MLKQGPDFHFEISGYLISEVEITRVNCIYKHATNQHTEMDKRLTDRFSPVLRANKLNLRCDSGKTHDHNVLHKLSHALTKER